MKIIYDTEQPPHRRVQYESDDGSFNPCPSYALKVELGNMIFECKRWGTAKDLKAHREAIARALEKEAPDEEVEAELNESGLTMEAK